jgi:hypothetical protein
MPKSSCWYSGASTTDVEEFLVDFRVAVHERQLSG